MSLMFVKCEKKDCFCNIDGKCDILAGDLNHECPFYKTSEQLDFEDGVLDTTPSPNWKEYRRRTKIQPITVDDIAKWLARYEELVPTTDREVASKVHTFLKDSGAVIPVETVIKKITAWMELHPQGKGYCMSSEETARRILEREDDEDADDEIDKADAEISSERSSK